MSNPVPSQQVIQTAAKNLRDVLEFAFEHGEERAAVVVWDGDSELSRDLTEAYRRCLPEATFIPFDRVPQTTVLAAFQILLPKDLVVLIQSTSFRLDAFRIRVHLFQQGLKVIEHPHLARMTGEEAQIYAESLAYDPAYFRGVGAALKARIDRAQRAVIDSGGEELVFDAGFEPAKLNVGDYRELKNIGGQFPIGEVFTESKDLEAVQGRLRIGCFGDTSFTVNRPPQPITLVVERGRVCAVENSTPEFERVLASIRADEGDVRIRELGFGLNRAFTRERLVTDIGTYERMCGIHLSLGAKHMTYKKPDIQRRAAKHHVDVFAITQSVSLDGEELYRDGAWLVG